MDLRTYQAYTMAEAMAAVKQDLGGDAVIVATRTLKRGGVLGIGARTVVEVTAGPAPRSAAPTRRGAETGIPDARARAAAAYARPATGTDAGATNGSTNGAPAPGAGSSPDGDVAQAERQRLLTRRLAQAMLEQHERKQREAAAAAPPVPVATPASEASARAPARSTPAAPSIESFAARWPASTASSTPNERPTSIPTPAPAPAPADERLHALEAVGDDDGPPRAFRLRLPGGRARRDDLGAAPDAGATAPAPAPRRADDPAARSGRTGTVSASAIEDELAAIRSLVGEVLRRQDGAGPASRAAMPEQLFKWYLHLVGQELADELAARVLREARADLAETELDDPQRVRAAVHRRLAACIPTADVDDLVRPADGRPFTLALVGPTGVGKTTTLAKLAAAHRIRHGRKVGLVTADTYRIAAVEQLRTYAEILGAPLHVAMTPDEMRSAVRGLRDCDIVLVDTAGRSQNDIDRIDELRAFLDAAGPHETHLVLSGTASERVLLREAEAFGAVGVDRVVLTKLDEAVSFGMLVSVVRRIGKEVSFVTTGQEVPDDLELGSGDRLAGLVMGEMVRRARAERRSAAAGRGA